MTNKQKLQNGNSILEFLEVNNPSQI